MKNQILLLPIVAAVVLAAICFLSFNVHSPFVGFGKKAEPQLFVGDNEQQREKYLSESVSFFGKTVDAGTSTQVISRIGTIAHNDTMLSLNGNVLTVGGVNFGVNIGSECILIEVGFLFGFEKT